MSANLSALRSGASGRTKDFEFVRGEYAIAGELVPYFAISMSVNEAIQHLALASSLAVDPEDPVKIDELIQRDVKRSRAEGEIVSYLKEPGRLKFFNSFTVVLMPLDDQGRPTRQFAQVPDGVQQAQVDDQGLRGNSRWCCAHTSTPRPELWFSILGHRIGCRCHHRWAAPFLGSQDGQGRFATASQPGTDQSSHLDFGSR